MQVDDSKRDNRHEEEEENVDAAASAEAVVNYAAIYKQFCLEENCRPNSALLKLIAADPKRPLQTLPLASNYVGPKGFAAIARFIDECQTLETLELRGNGLNNSCVARLCEVVERHLGVTTIDLSDNPITLDGGKMLMRLVEKNSRITKIAIEKTDIFDSLAARLDMALRVNRGAKDPALVLSRPMSSKPISAAAAAALAESIKTAVTTAKRPSTATVTPIAFSRQAAAGPHVSSAKPRPPIPAVASRDASRLGEAQRAEMKLQYQRRVEAFAKVEKSQAAMAAEAARRELMMLEAAEKRRAASARQRPPPQPPQSEEGEAPAQRPSTGDAATHTPHPPPLPPQQYTASGSSSQLVGGRQNTDSMSTRDEEWASVNKDPAAARDNKTPPFAENDEKAMKAAEAETVMNIATTDPVAAELEHAPTPPRRRISSVMDKSAAAALSAEEQFRTLFNLGCRRYNEKDLDGAYITWNEAMEVAASERNREWIAILTTNLQRLCYEMLAAQGARHLEQGELDKADEAFANALETAVKAKNAGWEQEMHRARKNVLHAVFQKQHRKAASIVDRLYNYKPVQVTDDDCFVEDEKAEPSTVVCTANASELPVPLVAGGQGQQQRVIVRHSPEYVNEWTRMLLIKEALESWVDARVTTVKIGGTSATVLLDVVLGSLANLCNFEIKRRFVPEHTAPILSLLNTAKYTPKERANLLALWTELDSATRTLQFPLWDAITNAVLGHLHLSCNALKKAIRHFELLASAAEEIGDDVLQACGHTYIGIVHSQRSSFSEAEEALHKGLQLWAETRKQLGAAHSAHVTLDEGGSVRGGKGNWWTAAFVAHMHSRTLQVLTRCYIGSFRYRQALEVHERSLLHKRHDAIYDKILHNFSANPTCDHITAISSSLNSPLLYLSLDFRFDYNPTTECYDQEEQLYMWVVPPQGDLKFVLVGVTAEFRTSIYKLIDQTRHALIVDPLSTVSAHSTSILTVPEMQWKRPLQQLYQIIMNPIVDFLTAHVAASEVGLVTVIPSGVLWLVPFPALMNPNSGKYVIEQFALAHDFSASQLAFTELSALRVKERGNTRRFVVAQPDLPPVPWLSLPFPLDAARSIKEAQGLQSLLHAEMIAEGMVEPGVLKDLLAKARVVHFATPCTQPHGGEGGCDGGLCVATNFDKLGVFRSDDFGALDFPAELVVFSNNNIAKQDIDTEQGTLDVVRAALNAGCSCCVTSMWCTSDMMPFQLFSHFYDCVKTQTNKAKALSLAIRRLIDAEDFGGAGRFAPRHWAGYMAIGVGEL